MNHAERIGTLLFRHTRKELSRTEKAELDSWRNRSAENERLFQEETDPENIRANYIRMLENKKAVRKRLEEKFPDIFTASLEQGRYFSFLFTRSAAACGLVLIAVSYFIFRGHTSHKKRNEAVLVNVEGIETALDNFHRGYLVGYAGIRIVKNEQGELEYWPPGDSTASPDKHNRLYTPSNCRFCIQLLPGIRIWLNEKSSVIYPLNLSTDTLRVQIEGEAYIETTRDLARPLFISAQTSGQVLARGHFNVQANADSAFIRATLIEGTASVHLSEKEISLLPGQQALVQGQTITLIKGVDVHQVIAWMK